MSLWSYIWIAIGLVAAFGAGWIAGDDHGRNEVNRQWTDKAEREYRAAKWPRGTHP